MSRTPRASALVPALLALPLVQLLTVGVVPDARSASPATGHAQVVAEGIVP